MTHSTAAAPFSEGETGQKRRALRPRDAASVMVLDRSQVGVRVLVGKRSKVHVFMPDLHVFPGGRRDKGDLRLNFEGDLHPAVFDKLGTALGRQVSPGQVRAVAVAALRELYEETHLSVGQTADGGNASLPFLPDLTNLRYMARAITPPGFSRRFDTHFFALFTDEAGLAPDDVQDSRELEDVRWVDVADAASLSMPDITRTILDDLRAGLACDPSLPFERAVPFYHTRHGRSVRDMI